MGWGKAARRVSAPAEWSLRTRLLLLVVLGVVAPLALIGEWTTRTAVRSGESLLRAQLDSTLARAMAELESRWQVRRADLLILAENEPTRLVLRSSARVNAAPPEFVMRAVARSPLIQYVVVRDTQGKTLWTLGDARSSAGGAEATRGTLVERTVFVRLPVTDLTTGDTIGSLEARVNAASLVPSITAPTSTNGPLTALFIPAGEAVLPPAADQILFDRGVDHLGQRWLVVRKKSSNPELEIAIAGALDPFVAPFERTAQQAALALFVAALLVIVVVVFVVKRITQELEAAVEAAETVTAGNVSVRLPVRSRDEVGRLATAFNAMTDSLGTTMEKLSRKEALAAVGEFATELAHEVRNPLTAMRLDLQRVEESAGDETVVRGITSRVLRQLERLDRAVTGALRASRGNGSGSVHRSEVDLREVIDLAGKIASPEFNHRRARLVVDAPRENAKVHGDAAALEQVFVNLLVNAAHALDVGGGGEVHVSISVDGDHVVSCVSDNGVGMTERDLIRTSEPYRSSKRDGSGLGLKIVRRIVEAHGGTIQMRSGAGEGTEVSVALPRASPRVH
jgi:two-component system sensor histidine kinase AtoS